MIGVAIIGTGRWGPNLIRNFREHPKSRLVRLVDIDTERLARAQARYPEAIGSTELDDVLGDPNVDACVVATPTSTHFEIARAVLDAGKHVLVEKPMTTCSSDAEELCRIADAANRVLMTGHVFVYNAAIQAANTYLQDGSLGRIYYISMVRTNLGPIRVDVNSAWDLAAHDIAIANWWLRAQPVSVSATGGTWINDGLADAVFASFRYPKDILVKIDVSWLNPRKIRDITVVGDKRMLTVSDMDLTEPVRIYDKGVSDEEFVDSFASFRASTREGDISVPRIALTEPLWEECNHFLQCIEDGTSPLSGGPEGLAVVRALEAVDRSMAENGREVAV